MFGDKFILRADTRAGVVECQREDGSVYTRNMTDDERRAYRAADMADPHYDHRHSDGYSCLD